MKMYKGFKIPEMRKKPEVTRKNRMNIKCDDSIDCKNINCDKCLFYPLNIAAIKTFGQWEKEQSK